MEEKDIEQKAIRTYESDIAEAIQHHQTSQVSMTLADEEKKRNEQESTPKTLIINKASDTHENRGKHIIMIVSSVFLLGAGIAVTYYFYSISPLSVHQPATPETTQTTLTVSSIITPDTQKVIDITGQNGAGILSKIQEIATNTRSNNAITEIIFGSQASTTGKANTSSLVRITGPQFISDINLVPPDALISSLTDQWMFGIYQSTPFIILTDNFFQNAFAGMLKWEPSMSSDLSNLFGFQTSQWIGGKFQDKIIKNKDVREFIDSSGDPLFLYSFIDNNTFVIAENEATLSEIITRFESRAYVR